VVLGGSGLTLRLDGCQGRFMTATVESFIQEYARRYSDHDPEAVTELCFTPSWRSAAARRFTSPILTRCAIISPRSWMHIGGGGAAIWSPVAIDTRRLGKNAAFTTVRWNALDTEGEVVRDTETTYHLLADSAGWHFLSYTNHF
jgi:hypothetical protein